MSVVSCMRILWLTLFVSWSLFAADVVTVDGDGVTTVAGTKPTTAPTSAQVVMGGGTVMVGRTTNAIGSEVVHGGDSRLVKAPDGDKLDGLDSTMFVPAVKLGVASGVATLDVNGKVSASHHNCQLQQAAILFTLRQLAILAKL